MQPANKTSPAQEYKSTSQWTKIDKVTKNICFSVLCHFVSAGIQDKNKYHGYLEENVQADTANSFEQCIPETQRPESRDSNQLVACCVCLSSASNRRMFASGKCTPAFFLPFIRACSRTAQGRPAGFGMAHSEAGRMSANSFIRRESTFIRVGPPKTWLFLSVEDKSNCDVRKILGMLHKRTSRSLGDNFFNVQGQSSALVGAGLTLQRWVVAEAVHALFNRTQLECSRHPSRTIRAKLWVYWPKHPIHLRTHTV